MRTVRAISHVEVSGGLRSRRFHLVRARARGSRSTQPGWFSRNPISEKNLGSMARLAAIRGDGSCRRGVGPLAWGGLRAGFVLHHSRLFLKVEVLMNLMLPGLAVVSVLVAIPSVVQLTVSRASVRILGEATSCYGIDGHSSVICCDNPGFANSGCDCDCACHIRSFGEVQSKTSCRG